MYGSGSGLERVIERGFDGGTFSAVDGGGAHTEAEKIESHFSARDEGVKVVATDETHIDISISSAIAKEEV